MALDTQRPDRSRLGRNSWRHFGYGGPCPPGGLHHYVFRLYALDTRLDLAAGVTKAELERAMAGHVLATAELVGAYRRGWPSSFQEGTVYSRAPRWAMGRNRGCCQRQTQPRTFNR